MSSNHVSTGILQWRASTGWLAEEQYKKSFSGGTAREHGHVPASVGEYLWYANRRKAR